MRFHTDPTTGASVPGLQKNFWNVALPIAGMALQYLSNQGAQRNANRAMRGQDALIDRQTRAMDERWRIANEMRNQGFFDPTQAINQATNLNLEQEGVARGNLAGALRVAGYARGDSEYRVRDDALAEKYRASRTAQRFQLARQVGMEQLQAFDPGYTSAANPGIQTYGNRAEMFQGQQAPLGPAVAAMAPFFQQPQQGFNVQNAFRFAGAARNFRGFRG